MIIDEKLAINKILINELWSIHRALRNLFIGRVIIPQAISVQIPDRPPTNNPQIPSASNPSFTCKTASIIKNPTCILTEERTTKQQLQDQPSTLTNRIVLFCNQTFQRMSCG